MSVSAAVMAQGVLVVTAATLFYVAFTDLKQYKIRNELILVLTGLFFLHSFLSSQWTSLPSHVGFAALMFLVLLYCYSKKIMGGGDLKLLVVATLWTGPDCALPFAEFLLLFSGAYALAVMLKWIPSKIVNGKKQVAFAPTIAAALIAVFMLGCVRLV